MIEVRIFINFLDLYEKIEKFNLIFVIFVSVSISIIFSK